MIAGVTCGKVLPQEIAERIVDRTGGVPPFVEELTKSRLSWLNRNRRLAKDFEVSIASARACVLCRLRAAPH